jgi:ribosomal protein S20
MDTLKWVLRNTVKWALGHGKGIQGCIDDAESGDVEAQCGLGEFYERGSLGLPQDYVQAAKWYLKAAEQGHSQAQLYLGVLMAQGQGVEQNLAEAYKWVDLAKRGSVFTKAAAIDTQSRLVKLMNPAQIDYGKMFSRNFVPTKRKR